MIKQNDSDLMKDLNKQTNKKTSKKWMEKWENLKEVENTSKIFNLIEFIYYCNEFSINLIVNIYF